MANNDGRLNFKATLDDAEMQKKLESLDKGVEAIGKTSEKSGKVLDTNIKESTKSASVATRAFSSMGNSIKMLFASFGSVAAIMGIFSLIRGAFNDVIAFDKSMVNMGAIAGKTRSELKGLESDIRKVASESLNSATAVADMATELIKLGTSVDGVSDLLKPVNDLSIASGMTADATAVLLKGTLNAFQETEKEALRYADVIAQSLNSTALDAQKFADSFTYIASTANVAGYSIEETASMIGVLVDNNVQASSAGRVLSSVFGRLAKGGKGLDAELEKIRTSQDKLAQASKVFGAEGARLGVILANNKTRMAELTREFQNSGGALAELTNKQLESMSAKLNIVSSGWQEFILSMENGQGRLAVIFKGLLDNISMVLVGLAQMAKGADQVAKERQDSFGKGEVEQIDRMTEAYISQRKARFKANKEVYTSEMEDLERKEKKEELISYKQQKNADRLLEIRNRLAILDKTPDSRNGAEIISLQKERERLEAGYNALGQERKAINQIVVKEEEETATTTLELTKERLAFLRQINNVERELNDEVLSGRELALKKIERKYSDLIAKAKELGMTDSKLMELQKQEIAVTTYKQDTDALKDNLASQEVLYKEFETTKKEIGEEQAKEMYKNLLNVSKSYYDLLSDELDKIDTKDMTAVEKDRYAELSMLLIKYSDEVSLNERKVLADLYKQTETYEKQITLLREQYSKKRALLESEFEGVELVNRISILERELKLKLNAIFEDMESNGGRLGKLTDAVVGATKQQIMAQINSLRGFLETTKDLTKSQIDSINAMINSLNSSLSSATDNGVGGRLSQLNNEVKQINSTIKELQDKAQRRTELFGGADEEVAEINAQIDALNVRLKSISSEKYLAIGEEFLNISNYTSSMANDLKDVNSSASKMFSTLSKVSSIAGNISTSFGNMKSHIEATNNGTADFSSALSAGGGYLGMFTSIAGAIDGIMQKSRENEKRREEERRLANEQYYLGELRWQREMLQLETERARREGLGLKSKRSELKALHEEALNAEKQLESLFNEINNGDQILQTAFVDGYGYVEYTNTTVKGIIDQLKKDIYDLEFIIAHGVGTDSDKSMLDSLRKKLKYWQEDVLLAGKTWQELQKMLDKGLVPKDMIKTTEEFVNLNKKWEELGYTIEDVLTAMKELATGTSIEQLSDSLANAFAKGEDAVYSFGNTIEDVLKNAVVSAFKNEFIVNEMKGVFDLLGDFGQDGKYTQDELDEIRKLAKETVDKLNQQWQAITGGLDIDFMEDTLGGSAKDGIKRITETQADRLTGILTGMQVDVITLRNNSNESVNILKSNRDLLNSSLSSLIAIEVNTRQTAVGVSSMDSKMDIVINTLQNNQNQALGL